MKTPYIAFVSELVNVSLKTVILMVSSHGYMPDLDIPQMIANVSSPDITLLKINDEANLLSCNDKHL